MAGSFQLLSLLGTPTTKLTISDNGCRACYCDDLWIFSGTNKRGLKTKINVGFVVYFAEILSRAARFAVLAR
jgi:hypothetical protein